MDIEGQFLCENLQQEFMREFMDWMEHPDLTRPFISYPKNPLAWTRSLFGGKRPIANQKWMDPMIRTSQTLSMAPL